MRVAAFVLSLFATSAMAEETSATHNVAEINIDFSQPILSINGDAQYICLKNDDQIPSKCEKRESVTLGNLAFNAIAMHKPDDPRQALNVDEIVFRGALAERLYRGGAQKLTPEELIEIKAAIQHYRVDNYIQSKALKMLGAK